MLEELEFSKYKRFFAFGCSFTRYIWATWADILAQEMPEAQYYNFGREGSGNLMISTRIAEANNRFNFCETDLVAVMFSTFTREDRWVNGNWLCTGNIFNQRIYSKEFVTNFADEIGYLIRDCALIDLSSDYLKNKKSNSILLTSASFEDNFEGPDKDSLNPYNVLHVYSNLKNKIHTITQLHEDLRTGLGFDYIMNGKSFHDAHPTPKQHLNYLTGLGINVSNKSKEYAILQDQLLRNCKTYEEIILNSFQNLPKPPTDLF